MKKGIFHIHSTISYDGLNSFSKLASFVEKFELDFIILSDHDTINGSLHLSKILKERGFKVEVPITAEYKTSKGDIIATYINKEIKNLEWHSFISEVKNQGGVLILPHPYDGHKDIEELAANVDAIEVFNSRSSLKNNCKSYLLAKKFKKPMLWASDSHLPFTLKNVIVGYEGDILFRDALLQDKVIPIVAKRSTYFDLFFSQLKKALIKKDLMLVLAVSLGLVVRILRSFTTSNNFKI